MQNNGQSIGADHTDVKPAAARLVIPAKVVTLISKQNSRRLTVTEVVVVGPCKQPSGASRSKGHPESNFHDPVSRRCAASVVRLTAGGEVPLSGNCFRRMPEC